MPVIKANVKHAIAVHRTNDALFRAHNKNEIWDICWNGQRRSNYDVTDSIDVTRTQDVYNEITRLFYETTDSDDFLALQRSFEIFDALYDGKHPAYHRCDTEYHNKQHVLDVTLATLRMIAGRERSVFSHNRFSTEQVLVAVITALFHDVGYLRKRDEYHVRHGAEFTRIHVSRSADFLFEHMKTVGLQAFALIAKQLVHFTGYEYDIEQIKVPNQKYRDLGNIIGTADVIAQMADRTYLEKCRNHLYPEFVRGGMCEQSDAAGKTQVIYSSADELLLKTPTYMRSVFNHRLTQSFNASFRYIEDYFFGVNVYLINVQKNFAYLLHQVSKIEAGESAPLFDEVLLRRSTILA